MPRLVALALAVLCLLPGAASSAELRDAKGRAVTPTSSDRIVSLGGDVTEILYALGAGNRIIAVDTTSQFPSEAREKPNVGYLRALSAEGVLAMRPGMILASEDAGPPTTVQVLETASVPFVMVPKGQSAAGVAQKIRFVARAIGEDERGEALAKRAEAAFATLGDALAKVPGRPKAMFVLSLNGGRPIVAGRETSAGAAIELAGGTNPFTGMEGYKPVSDEAVVAAAPDVIVIMTRSSHMPSEDDVFALPALVGTPAGRDKRLVIVDALSTLTFGPRAPEAIGALARRLHPDLPLPPSDQQRSVTGN